MSAVPDSFPLSVLMVASEGVPFAKTGGLADVTAADGPLASDYDIEYRRELFRWAADRVQETVAETTWQSFWLTHVQQQPIGVVAENLGISVGNVYVGRSRVMTRLRETIKSLEETE